MKRLLSSPFFLVAVVAFLLPFFSVQCAGGEGFGELGLPTGPADLETDVTGLELVTGEAEEELEQTSQAPTEIPGLETPIPTPETQAQDLDLGTVQIFAIGAAAIAVLGIILSLLGGRPGGALALLLGAAGGVLLFLTASQFKDAVLGEAEAQLQGLIEVKNEGGFWLALGGFAIAALTGLLRVVMPGARPAPRPAAGTATGFGPPSGGPPPTAPPPATPPSPPPPSPPPPTPPPGSPPPTPPPGSTPPTPPPGSPPPTPPPGSPPPTPPPPSPPPGSPPQQQPPT
jgi:hypothetical protein